MWLAWWQKHTPRLMASKAQWDQRNHQQILTIQRSQAVDMSLNPFWLFLIIGVALVAIELLVFQFTTFWLFFIGLGALVAAGYALLTNGVTYTATMIVFLGASVAFTILLYAPIRRWQNKPSAMSDNNAIGQQVTVKEPVGPATRGTVSWSGSDWQAELAQGELVTLNTGDIATVVSVEGIRLLIRPA